jgi:PilZ domain-containing protein
MEQRREHRVTIEQSVALTVLGDPETRITATIKNASGRGLGLVSPQSVLRGAAVKLEIGDSIFLGEVMYCETLGDGNFLGIELTEVLSGLAALSRMAQQFREELELEPAASHRQ